MRITVLWGLHSGPPILGNYLTILVLLEEAHPLHAHDQGCACQAKFHAKWKPRPTDSYRRVRHPEKGQCS